ncbi:MAG: branched-chain amino acid ABC transporter permease [Candidatus Bipolaricaulota bacterium]|nr:MAG: branched-chain amino acid ABC transporter permease [Candidatus Bipolaricaulota bacterium]
MINYLVFFAITAGTYGVLSLGLNLQWGYTGLFNIGVAAFYAVGAYASALVSGPPPDMWDGRLVGGFELPFILGILAAALAAGIIAFLIGIPTLRLRADYLAIATIGIAETIRMVLKNEAWLTNGVWGLQQLPSPFYDAIHRGATGFVQTHPDLSPWLRALVLKAYNWFYLFLVIAALFLLYLFLRRLAQSPWGRVLRAIREDEVVASMSGKNVFAFKLQALVLGAMIMGIGGAFYAHYARFISPTSFEPFYGTFIVWVMLILGGTGNNKGAILGAFVVWGTWAGTDFITGYLPLSPTQEASLRIIVIGILLVSILLVRPQGLLPEMRQRRRTPRTPE